MRAKYFLCKRCLTNIADEGKKLCEKVPMSVSNIKQFISGVRACDIQVFKPLATIRCSIDFNPPSGLPCM